jgi:hypothetical protein
VVPAWKQLDVKKIDVTRLLIGGIGMLEDHFIIIG